MVSILVNGGGGTIGVPLLEQLKNLGYSDVFASKRSADDRTKRFAEAMDGYKMLMVDGGSSEKEFSSFGLDVRGYVSDYLRDNVFDLIIDCSPSHKTSLSNRDLFYNKYSPNTPVMYNGGVEQTVFGRDFVAAPNCVGDSEWDYFKGRSLRHVSCNTTASATILGLISEVIEPSALSHVDITYLRRFADPHENKKEPKGLEIKVSSHHKDDIAGVFRGIGGSLETMTVKGGWRHFHGIIMDVNTKDKVEQWQIDKIKENMIDYPLCIYSEPKTNEEGLVFDMDKIIKASYEYGFSEGDLPIPSFGVQRRNDNKFIIIGLTPQMKIVAPSQCMGISSVLGEHNTFDESLNNVVTNMRFTKNAYSVRKVKRDFEDLLNI